ncbi:argonaute/piwi family protein [Pseudomonas sp. PDM20]|uniref:argonaute/piwi family protein n=1 Tax=Pseudomonas sp. PDM20 TaxID=2769254 RepID=UPI001781BC81|nr:nuclease PIN [Pseudomonas sp. PDM20]MBD9686044.1 nuclease PIN [Pseudomonas sp. PDM20]
MNTRTVPIQLPAFTLLDEPLLAFSVGTADATHRHPLIGLSRFGAFDQASFRHYVSDLRIAYVGPRSGAERVRDMRDSLRVRQRNTDRSSYAQEYPGFSSLFGVDLSGADQQVHVKWPEDLNDFPGTGEAADRVRAALHQALIRLSATRDQFDVALVYFPDRWLRHLRTKEFDAHDELKALAAQLGIPTQVVNDKSLSFNNWGARAWRLAIALYAKAGGTPWKLSPIAGAPADTAYIGLAYAIRRSSAHYVTCCSQVFDMEGGGMQFVAFEANDSISDEPEARRNPFLSKADMRAVLTRSLRLYLEGHGGRVPRRLVIHKTTAFTEDELKGVQEATFTIPEVECLEIGSSSAWRGVWLVENSSTPASIGAAKFPVPRGTFVMTSGNSALLWIAGNAPSVVGGRDYFQGAKSIPKPIFLRRHMGRGPFDLLASEAIALAKMDWNNDALYDPLPVTIMYSQRLARTISNVMSLPNTSYPYRLFM